jgi:hypothetical protein
MPHLVHKLKARDSTGRWAYYFVLVEEAFAPRFEAIAGGGGSVDLEDFGVVLASSYGETPTPQVVEYLRDRYGLDVGTESGASAPPSPSSPTNQLPPIPSNPPQFISLAALRQYMGLNSWRWLILLVPPRNQQAFTQSVSNLAALDKGGLGANGKGLLGGLRKTVDAVNASHFNIEALAPLGTVIARGKGASIPADVLRRVERNYLSVFDWKDWQTKNVAYATFAEAVKARR